MVVMTPSDEQECRDMLFTGYHYQGPAAVRYPRGSGTGVTLRERDNLLEVGKAKPVRDGKQVAILNFGTLLPEAIAVAEAIDATVIDMRFVKPIDKQAIVKAADEHQLLVTLEENATAGGAGSAVNESLAEAGLTVQTLNIGLPDEFIKHGSQNEVKEELGLTQEAIKARIQAHLKQ